MKCYKCGIRPAEIKEVGSENGVPYINYYCRKCYNEIKSNNGDRSAIAVWYAEKNTKR